MFSPPAAASVKEAPYYYRHYSSTQRFLALSSADDHVKVFDATFDNLPLDVGSITPLLPAAGCSDCTASGCPGNAVAATRQLNDTGITTYANASSNSLTSEPTDYPGQDARYGRDAQAAAGTLAKKGAGAKGFDFTKIANDGSELPATAALGSGTKDWACTRDNVTGLLWEIKTTSGLRSQNHSYTWYRSDTASNGGSAGTPSGGSCATAGHCDTEKFVQDVNAAGLCGRSDWRMPSRNELVSMVDYGKSTPPAVDSDWFPNTPASNFWSASALAGSSGLAWDVDFYFGYADYGSKSGYGQVRLVRAGQ
jgi:hypothetical protein